MIPSYEFNHTLTSVMDGSEHSAASTPGDAPSDVEIDQAVLDQSKKLEEMKSILKAQQHDLRQSLEALQRLEATKPDAEVRSKRLHSASDCEENGKHSHGDSSSQRHRSEPAEPASVEKRLEVQMCPICGAEFDNPSNPDALEEHVASHWCSSESSGIA